MLAQFGCRVDEATNGAEAIEALQNKWYPIIFMDCQMPVMDGFSATEEIRKLEHRDLIKSRKTTKDSVIVIALTANASPEDKARCLKSGMNDYLRKPCKFRDFLRVLEVYGRPS